MRAKERLKKFYSSNRSWVKPLLMFVVVVLYWIFVYYPYHYSAYTPISFVVAGTVLFFLGIYGIFIKKDVKFKDLKYLYYVILGFAVVSEIFILLAVHKHGLLSGIDITWAWIAERLGSAVAVLAAVLSFPVYYVMLAGTYKLLGKEHVYIWGLVCLAWTVSNIRLLIKFVIN